MIVYGLIVAAAVTIFFVSYILPLRRAKTLVEKASMIPRRFNIPVGTEIPTLTSVFVGDSIFAGVGASCWGATLTYQIASNLSPLPIRVVNVSRSKARAKDLASQLDDASPTLQGSLIFIFIGANDATHLTSIKGFQADLDHGLSRVSKAGARLVIATIPNLSHIPALRGLGRLFNCRAKKLNLIIHKLAELHGAELVDIYESALAVPELYASDEFHPNDEGYAQWASYYQANWSTE